MRDVQGVAGDDGDASRARQRASGEHQAGDLHGADQVRLQHAPGLRRRQVLEERRGRVAGAVQERVEPALRRLENLLDGTVLREDSEATSSWTIWMPPAPPRRMGESRRRRRSCAGSVEAKTCQPRFRRCRSDTSRPNPLDAPVTKIDLHDASIALSRYRLLSYRPSAAQPVTGSSDDHDGIRHQPRPHLARRVRAVRRCAGGTGPQGRGLAVRLAATGQRVLLGSRDAGRAARSPRRWPNAPPGWPRDEK